MEPNYTASSELPVRRKNKLPYVLIAVGMLIAGLLGWKLLNSATAQPEETDFKQLNYQRQIIDTSVEAYSHILTDYSLAYTNAHQEERGSKEKAALKQRAQEQFRHEAEVGRERLQLMAKSVAMKDDSVKTSFNEFRKQYESVFIYYDTMLSNLSRMNESVNGPCANLKKQNFAHSTSAKAFVTAADACLNALASARQGSDKRTDALLGRVEKMVREQRDKFNDVTTSEGLAQNASTMLALLEMLGTNNQVASIYTEYEKSFTEENTELVRRVNASNKALEDVLEKKITVYRNNEMARG